MPLTQAQLRGKEIVSEIHIFLTSQDQAAVFLPYPGRKNGDVASWNRPTPFQCVCTGNSVIMEGSPDT